MNIPIIFQGDDEHVAHKQYKPSDKLIQLIHDHWSVTNAMLNEPSTHKLAFSAEVQKESLSYELFIIVLGHCRSANQVYNNRKMA